MFRLQEVKLLFPLGNMIHRMISEQVVVFLLFHVFFSLASWKLFQPHPHLQGKRCIRTSCVIKEIKNSLLQKLFNVFPVVVYGTWTHIQRQILKKRKITERNREEQEKTRKFSSFMGWNDVVCLGKKRGKSVKEKYWLAKNMRNVINSIIMMFPLHLFA